jgi:hypothetical protein
VASPPPTYIKTPIYTHLLHKMFVDEPGKVDAHHVVDGEVEVEGV